jgi:hypothetical protein
MWASREFLLPGLHRLLGTCSRGGVIFLAPVRSLSEAEGSTAGGGRRRQDAAGDGRMRQETAGCGRRRQEAVSIRWEQLAQLAEPRPRSCGQLSGERVVT